MIVKPVDRYTVYSTTNNPRVHARDQSPGSCEAGGGRLVKSLSHGVFPGLETADTAASLELVHTARWQHWICLCRE